MKFAGVACLLYVAWAAWRDTSAFVVDEAAASKTHATATRLVVKAFLLNILNPKLTTFFLALLPQFVEPNAGSPIAQLFVLSAIFMAMTFAVFVVYGLLVHAFRSAVIKSHHGFRPGCAAASRSPSQGWGRTSHCRIAERASA